MMAIEALSGIDKAGTGAFATLGEINQHCGSTVPVGWMLCEGQLLAITEYPLLFSVIGNAYGGDGIDTFALPNYRYSGVGARRIICVDFAAPQTVLQVTVPAAIHGPAPGYYKAGYVLSFAAQLLEDIAITGGPVSLSLDMGGTVHSLAFTSGTAREWVFANYTVQPGDNGVVATTINLNSATLSTGGIPAVLSTSSMVGVIVDTSVPTITFSEVSFFYDTGGSAADFITNTPAQWIHATLSATLSGTERALGSIDNGTTWIDITNNIAGTSLEQWSVTLVSSNTLKLKVVDLAGNEGTVFSQAYTLDTTSPAVTPTVTAQTTSNTTPTMVGTATLGSGETLTVTVDETLYAIGANLSITGTDWTLQITTALSVGNHTVTAYVTDVAGNVAPSTYVANNLIITA